MADDLSEIWDPFDNAWLTHADKLAEPNFSVLTRHQLESSKNATFQAEVDNLKYMNKHPEVRAIIRLILREIINVRPKNVNRFVRDYFNRSIDELEALINTHIEDFPIVESKHVLQPEIENMPQLEYSVASTNLAEFRSNINQREHAISPDPTLSLISSAGTLIEKKDL